MKYSAFLEIVPKHLKSNIIVVLSKVDLLLPPDKEGEWMNVIDSHIQRLRASLLVEDCMIMPFTVKNDACAASMLDNIRKEVDVLVQSKVICQNTILGNLKQIIEMVQEDVAITEDIAVQQQEDHVFVVVDTIQNYILGQFEVDISIKASKDGCLEEEYVLHVCACVSMH